MTSDDKKIEKNNAFKVKPNFKLLNTKIVAVKISTNGYWKLIIFLQKWHLPAKKIKLISFFLT